VTVPTTENFTLSANEIIEKAFHRLGKASEGFAISARMYQDGRSSLNLLLKGKIGTSDRLFLRTFASLALVANQEGCTLDDDPFPLRIPSVRRRDADGNDVPLREMSRQEYEDLPNKASSPSIPVAFYFDPQADAGVLYVWPAPDTNAASDYTLEVTCQRRIADIDTSTDALDMPQEWLDPVIWLLADDLETEYPVNDARLAAKIERKAAEARQMLDYWDTETASVFMQPDLG
jgi:hypothetical protein